MKRLRGPKGTTVNLTIVRRGIKDKLIFKVKRDKIPVTTMDAEFANDHRFLVNEKFKVVIFVMLLSFQLSVFLRFT